MWWNKNYRRGVLSFLTILTLVGAILVAPAAPAAADPNPNPGVISPNARPHGLTYGEWSAKWWQWAFSMPVDHNPLVDTAPCSAHQSGPVWFLGGSFATTSVNRNCSLPAGKALFIPLLNSEASTIEGNGATEDELRTVAAIGPDNAGNLSMEVDGVALQGLGNGPDGLYHGPYRVQSSLYTYGPLPANNFLAFWGYDAPAGATSLSFADGIYVMLAPLSAGPHVIHFHGEQPAFNFSLDVTYNITVARGR